MKTTGIFTQWRHEVPFKQYGKPIKLQPFGDVHRSSPLNHTEKWRQFLDKAKKEKDTIFIGMGDYDDLSSTSERDILTNRHLHESTKQTLDQMYREYTERLYQEIKFMKGRIIGLVEGNHYSELASGITTTQLLCEKLDCKYLGVSAFIMLILKGDKHHSHRVDIWAHHGKSSGRTTGSSINKVEQMIDAARADIYLMGHDHKKHIAMRSILELSNNQHGVSLDNRKIIMARTGGFLKGYEDGKPSYIADGAYAPTDIGTVSISLTPMRKQTGSYPKRTDDRWLELNAAM